MDLATLEAQISTTIGQQETANGTTGVGATMNNPGGLQYQPWEAAYGATPGAGGFGSFPSLTAGKSALAALVAKYVGAGSSLSSLIASWSPPSAGNINNAARTAQLAAVTGLDPSQPIAGQAAAAAPVTSPPGLFTDPTEQYGSNSAALAAAGASPLGTSTAERIVAFILGFLFILGGLLLLKSTQQIIVQTGKAAGKVAELAA